MVTLVSNNMGQISLLQNKLIESGLEYEIRYSNGKHALGDEYLIVDGVPLDFNRAIKYITNKSKE